MQFEDFTKLSEEEQKTYFDSLETVKASASDHEIEIKSLKKELEEVKSNNETLAGDLKSTKELNFTLARQIDTSKNKPSFEDALLGAFGTKQKGKE